MTRLTLYILSPVTLWAVHFIAIYALISAACAPRGLLGFETLSAATALVTGVIGLVTLALLIRAGRGTRRIDTQAPEYPLAQAAWWSALISLLAVMVNVWPVVSLSGCAG